MAAALSMLPARRAASAADGAPAAAASPARACTVAIPARISTPPTAWIGVGICPSSRAAKITAKITSDSATNEAIELPSRRTASIPVT